MADIEIRRPSEEELAEGGIRKWPVWEKEAGTFDWHYDQPETCYLLEGRVRVTPKDGSGPVEFGAGDLVSFPEGLSCVWEISEDVRKHYRFG